MPYHQSIELCLQAALPGDGLTPDELGQALALAGDALARLRTQAAEGSLDLLGIVARDDDLAACREAVDHLARGAQDIVILGTGGSSLGGQALAKFADPTGTAGRIENRPRVHFADNLDPHSMTMLLRQLDLKTARFVVVSKSGGTPETVMQMLAALDALKASGLDWNAENHFLALTEPGDADSSALRHLCALHHIPALDHETGIGGRYSVLSNVGMLPALLYGLDPLALRAGAREVVDALRDCEDPADFAPALGAAVHAGFAARGGLCATVLMPYAERLRLFSDWWVQLWAESLGKQGGGITPVGAAGPVDQHSQLQLFLDGPRDKLFTIIMLEVAGAGPRVDPAYLNDNKVGYLADRTIGDLVDSEQRATARTLADNGRPVRTIGAEDLNERTLGALFMHFMIETILMGYIDGVDPFDQPAVEQGKRLAREYLSQM